MFSIIYKWRTQKRGVVWIISTWSVRSMIGLNVIYGEKKEKKERIFTLANQCVVFVISFLWSLIELGLLSLHLASVHAVEILYKGIKIDK